MTDEQVALLQDLIFNTVPGDLAGRQAEFRADMKTLHSKAKQADKADLAETLAESAIDLRSILAEWNLKNKCRFGDAVCSDGELDEESEKTVALLSSLGEKKEAKRARDEADAIKSSSLTRITRKTLAGECNTHWGNDYASGLRKAMQKGAILVTPTGSGTNSRTSWAAHRTRSSRFRELRRAFRPRLRSPLRPRA